jgi:hypothetical protein
MKPFTTIFLSSVALLLSFASFASAAELEWNQERVAALARDLIEPLDALGADLESRPPVSAEAAAHAAVLDDVQRLRVRAGELTERLGRGAGRAETVALFREIEALQSQAAKHSREYPAPFDMHVHVDRLQSITIQLARYYGSGSDPGS